VYKTAASVANCILLFAYSHTAAAPHSQLREHKAYLTSWRIIIFDYKLRTMKQKILKKLRTGVAST